MTNSKTTDGTWQTINHSDLATVAGGAGSASASSSTDVSSSLASIQTSIKDLSSSKKSSGGLDMTTALCIGLMMSRQNQGSSNTTVIAGAAPAASTSWSFRSRVSF